MAEKVMSRYIRQAGITGEHGQDRLARVRVLIAGAGGLGTVLSTLLTMAGVGFIRIVDCDIVETSDFNRQSLHWEEDLGRNKIDSVREKLIRMNPHVRIETRHARIDTSTADDLSAGCDLIVDALDNFETRFVLNRTAITKAVPLFHGAVSGFTGQTTTILPFSTPCLRCIFPDMPEERSPDVMGTTCGIIGAIQANEVIKHVCGTGHLLAGKLFIWDGLRNESGILDIRRNPACPDCQRQNAT